MTEDIGRQLSTSEGHKNQADLPKAEKCESHVRMVEERREMGHVLTWLELGVRLFMRLVGWGQHYCYIHVGKYYRYVVDHTEFLQGMTLSTQYLVLHRHPTNCGAVMGRFWLSWIMWWWWLQYVVFAHWMLCCPVSSRHRINSSENYLLLSFQLEN